MAIGLGRIRGRLAALRPRWAWILLALGLLWLLTPLSCEASAAGCLAMPLAWSFWTAVFTFAFLGLRALWRRTLFRVSRRLWVILSLVSVLPAAGLTVFFLSLSWIVLGGQANHLVMGELRELSGALRTANAESRDDLALGGAKRLGSIRMRKTDALPFGMKDGFVGLTLGTSSGDGRPDVSLVSVRRQADGYRILALDLDRVQARTTALWGGPVYYTLTQGRSRVRATWTVGKPLSGSGLYAPFRLPPIGFTVLDPENGKSLVLEAVPETSLWELFRGYGIAEHLKGIGRSDAMWAVWPVLGLLVLLALFQGVAMVLGFLLTSRLGSSVHQLYLGVQHLTKGDFRTRLRPKGRDQVAQLTLAFNDLAARLDQAEGEREERLRLEEELRVARDVQMRLLPDVSRLTSSIRAAILPAREVAGDYFDVLPLRDGRFAFLIADVSGKGTSAAFYAAETKGILSALDKEALGPQEVLARLNGIWRQSTPRCLFMTAIYGTFDPASGACAFVRAGHPAAFLRRADATVDRLAPRGLGIGLAPQPEPGTWEIWEGVLEPGDTLLFYTDGLTEAMDPGDALFGEERLATCLGEPLTDLPAHVLAAVQAFTQGRALEDDLTLLVLKR